LTGLCGPFLVTSLNCKVKAQTSVFDARDLFFPQQIPLVVKKLARALGKESGFFLPAGRQHGIPGFADRQKSCSTCGEKSSACRAIL